jgi:hypothetical protein
MNFRAEAPFLCVPMSGLKPRPTKTKARKSRFIAQEMRDGAEYIAKRMRWRRVPHFVRDDSLGWAGRIVRGGERRLVGFWSSRAALGLIADYLLFAGGFFGARCSSARAVAMRDEQ